jgi:hypothetical protein
MVFVISGGLEFNKHIPRKMMENAQENVLMNVFPSVLLANPQKLFRAGVA